MTKLTLVTPTIGRQTLSRTVNSVLTQKEANYKYIVIFDGIPATMSSQMETMTVVEIEKRGIPGTNAAGAVCQYGLDISDTKYVGFVDDDDTITNDYVSEFYNVISDEDYDLIVFKMVYKNGVIVPREKYIDFGNIGMSFIINKSFLKDKNIKFRNEIYYDFFMVYDIWTNKGKIYFSDKICYKVRPN